MSLANEKHLYYNKIREEVNRQMDLSRDYKWDKYTVYLHDLNAYARGQICTPHSHIGVEKVNLDILKRIYYKLFNTMEVSYAKQKQAH